MCSGMFCLCFTCVIALCDIIVSSVEWNNTDVTVAHYYLHKHAVFRINQLHDTFRDQSQNDPETHEDADFTLNSQTGQKRKEKKPPHNHHFSCWSVTFTPLNIMMDFWHKSTCKRVKSSNTPTQKSLLFKYHKIHSLKLALYYVCVYWPFLS